jgi:hypothetical protein
MGVTLDLQVETRTAFTLKFDRSVKMTLAQKWGNQEAGSVCEVIAMQRRTDCSSGVMFKARVLGLKSFTWLDAGWFKEVRFKK